MVLYGASGHGKVIMDILEANHIPLDFVVDDNPNLTELLGYEVRRNTGVYDEAIISIGSCRIRKNVVSEIKVDKYLTVIHPTAIVSSHAMIGAGTVVMQGSIIQTCAWVGRHCIINTGASVDHDCKLSDFVHVAPHATVAGNVEIGEGTWVGIGSVVKQGLKIGSWCVIGAGAVVVDDVPDNTTVVGIPAKPIKQHF